MLSTVLVLLDFCVNGYDIRIVNKAREVVVKSRLVKLFESGYLAVKISVYEH